MGATACLREGMRIKTMTADEATVLLLNPNYEHSWWHPLRGSAPVLARVVDPALLPVPKDDP